MESNTPDAWKKHALALLYGLLSAVLTAAASAFFHYLSEVDFGSLLFPVQTVLASAVARLKLG